MSFSSILSTAFSTDSLLDCSSDFGGSCFTGFFFLVGAFFLAGAFDRDFYTLAPLVFEFCFFNGLFGVASKGFLLGAVLLEGSLLPPVFLLMFWF